MITTQSGGVDTFWLILPIAIWRIRKRFRGGHVSHGSSLVSVTEQKIELGDDMKQEDNEARRQFIHQSNSCPETRVEGAE
jgi:hypothetical protein